MFAITETEFSICDALEINFAIKKFLELPAVLQRLIYIALYPDKDETPDVAAGLYLIGLVIDANVLERQEFVADQLRISPESWNMIGKQEYQHLRAFSLATYFKKHLRVRYDSFLIAPVDLTKFEE